LADLLKNNRVIPLYLVMLLGHMAHILEEIWGRFWLIRGVFGLGWYLIGNWILLSIPVALFYFLLTGRRLAYVLSIVYVSIMIANGLGHNIATLVSGKYFDGYAGGYTGVGLVLVGLPLVHFLRIELARVRQ
jgi:hypothetical protein